MPSGAGCLPRWNDFVSTSKRHPLYSALRGTLSFEVNFTGRGNPCQNGLKGRLRYLVKFTFRADPLQKGFWGRLASKVERLCIHLRALPPLQCPQRHIAFRGEFHRSWQPLPEVPERPIALTREIHPSRNPCQKPPQIPLCRLLKFTFRAAPSRRPLRYLRRIPSAKIYPSISSEHK